MSMVPRPIPFNAAQKRLDAWNDLRVHARWLAEYRSNGRAVDEPRSLVQAGLEDLAILERYWAFPGSEVVAEMRRLFDRNSFTDLAQRVTATARNVVGDAYREHAEHELTGRYYDDDDDDRDDAEGGTGRPDRPYFEVLVVDAIDGGERRALRRSLRAARRDEDEFVYGVVDVPSFEDAVIAALFNRTVQACVLRYDFAFHSTVDHPALERFRSIMRAHQPKESYGLERSVVLAKLLKQLRPELDLYLVTDTPLDHVAGELGRDFRRTFYRLEQHLELHLSILRGIQSRYEAPFFDALRRYSQKPTGVFHALPVARAKSMTNSHWARDLLEFYGSGIFLAETSATSGGLDSLLQPRGPIKKAQEKAARAFGAKQSYFVTNGTSTANKIVVQGLTTPGDIVLVDRACHKSHHYALVLAGARPVYLDAYPLVEHAMYGGVPLELILRRLRGLRDAGLLDRVRMLLLTNCTFDGITYDPVRVMRAVLAIKPDMIFVWDEAWFAFGSFHPTLRPRTAMASAARLRAELRGPEYRARYEAARADGDTEGMPDPDRVRIRVYATHSTHKTLTALRQGSMIHVYDEDFETRSAYSFHESYMTHTSTSPNYQIVASLDVGRRQMELEGYELVDRSIGLAMALRERIYEHPAIQRYFSVLRPADMIPAEFRTSGLEAYYDPESGWARMDEAWRSDEFTLDPTRVTVALGRLGVDGDAFRNLLMDRHDIQINKTSRNTALFMTNIGTARGDVAYLVDVLVRIAQDAEEEAMGQSSVERSLREQRIRTLTLDATPLPDFSRFHDAFEVDGPFGGGSMREAFFLSCDETNVSFLHLDGIAAALERGDEVVSAAFVTPYPPGFPVLVPGQVVSAEILAFLRTVGVPEIHGYDALHGLRIFAPGAIEEGVESAAEAIAVAHDRSSRP